MTNEKTGGAAFPTVGSNGMTMLDYFAAKAMYGILAGDISDDNPDEKDFKELSRQSYEIAAAMLEERKKYLTP